ncbi:MAG: GGDEF domain-containing protein [Sphingorhabdus sp.]
MQKAHKTDASEKSDTAAPALADMQRENDLLKQRIVELEQLVIRDTLTPLFNRRHFVEVLERWSWRAHRYGGNYGIIFIDVDDLKKVNDNLGHVTGDKVLVAIANVLQNNIRRSDVAARLGGDEFAVMLDSANPEGVAIKAKKLRTEVAKLKIKSAGQAVSPTISVGHAMIEAGKSAEELLLKADRNMYAQKHAGKKQVGPGD